MFENSSKTSLLSHNVLSIVASTRVSWNYFCLLCLHQSVCLSVCLSICLFVCLLFPSHFPLVSFRINVLILWMISWSHICGALRDLVQPGSISHFLNCANDTKSWKASHIIQTDRARFFLNFWNGSSIPYYANPCFWVTA